MGKKEMFVLVLGILVFISGCEESFENKENVELKEEPIQGETPYNLPKQYVIQYTLEQNERGGFFDSAIVHKKENSWREDRLTIFESRKLKQGEALYECVKIRDKSWVCSKVEKNKLVDPQEIKPFSEDYDLVGMDGKMREAYFKNEELTITQLENEKIAGIEANCYQMEW